MLFVEEAADDVGFQLARYRSPRMVRRSSLQVRGSRRPGLDRTFLVRRMVIDDEGHRTPELPLHSGEELAKHPGGMARSDRQSE